MDNDDELNNIRKRKLEEMQRNTQQGEMDEENRKQIEQEEARRQQILRQILSTEARERLSTLKLVRPDLVSNVENQLIQLAGMGRINRVIGDEELKGILSRLIGSKRETRIERR
ncbi:MAG: DNA-binding protein [Candidatus Thermoplasmatota archaeon]|jgi:programmed cell death protein 5|uniref:DNA-binding protein n=1 Tax=Ferroplasma sp. TaxID=2591003 RepID=UPI002631EBA5|nr:DNA-binding protein [Ferroplasma sp.]MCL4311142.1 DNA-binding protein [Candidatus Thermoplasmatota archaeon]